jgi:hypothetical protein
VLFLSGCGGDAPRGATDTSPEAMTSRWAGPERSRVARAIAHDRLLVGWSRSRVHDVLGDPEVAGRPAPSGGVREHWSSGCSGPGCYSLIVEYSGDRVVSATFLDEG